MPARDKDWDCPVALVTPSARSSIGESNELLPRLDAGSSPAGRSTHEIKGGLMFDPIGKLPDPRGGLPCVRLNDVVKRRPVSWLGYSALLGYFVAKASIHLPSLDPAGALFSLTGIGMSLYLLNRIADDVEREKRGEHLKKMAEELGR